MSNGAGFDGRSPGCDGSEHLLPVPDRRTAELTFPDLPRLELDQLLEQLVERAQEVLATQGRLRGLLRATRAISGELALPQVLRRIAEAARELIGARYSALGVIAPDGHLSEFVHSGMPPDTVAKIGRLPEGKGLLGALIGDPRPIRLRDMSADPRSSGFPPGHPTMRDFLGVPIRVRGEVFGNLYLADKQSDGGFSPEDAELAEALAAAAGAAIDNARLYQAARNRSEWLRASAAITRSLLSSNTEGAADPLTLIAESARDLADAELVTVALPGPATHPDAPRDGELRVQVAVGECAGTVIGRTVPVRGTLAGAVYTSGASRRLSHPAADPAAPAATLEGLDIGPVLATPLLGSRRTHGVLTLARRPSRPEFRSEDLEMAAVFASQASVALELAEARAEQQRCMMAAERDRIADDLHDHVIKQIFGASLALHGLAARMPDDAARARLGVVAADLDRAIDQIRSSIFQLREVGDRNVGDKSGTGVRDRLLTVATEASAGLGFDPAVRFTGLLDHPLADELVDDLRAVLREALTNVGRHAHARTATVEFDHSEQLLTLRVSDDGVGIVDPTRRGGLTNLRRRAEKHGGTLTVEPAGAVGTVLTWTAPS